MFGQVNQLSMPQILHLGHVMTIRRIRAAFDDKAPSCPEEYTTLGFGTMYTIFDG
jgi:hypothetical protein